MTIAAGHVFPGAVVYEHGNVGYPYRGSRRRITPTILEGAHITGNAQLPSALAEMQYSARAGSGASFTFAINRNGSIVQGFDPFLFAPWTNGDLKSPDLLNPLIAAMVGSPYNPNEFCLYTVEHVGYEPGSPITAAQAEASGRIARWAADVAQRDYGWRLPIDRMRIIGHRQINSITRLGCPTRGDLNALKDQMIRAAQPEGDDMDGRPRTFHRRSGVASLPKGVQFNAFRFLGLDAAGKPMLQRLNGFSYDSGTSAVVIGRAHWESGKSFDESYLVSPYCFVPGHGEQTLLWWSRDPLPEPKVTWDATDDGVDRGDVAAAADAVRDAVISAANTTAQKYGAG